MTVPNPTAAPTLALPTVHVHGATSWRRRVFLILVAMLPAVVAFVVVLVAPLRVGVGVDVSVSVLPSWSLTLVVWMLLAVRAFPPIARWSRHAASTLCAAAWAVGAAVSTMDRDAVAWSSAAIVVIVVATFTGLWLAWWVGGLRFGVVWPLVRPAPPAASPTTRSAWSETVTHTTYTVLLLVLSGLAAIFFVAVGFESGVWVWLLPLAALALLSAMSFTVRITADRRGLRIRSRILGIPLVTVPLDRIASATAALIDETEWGQVGSTADRELTTIIHRSGAALIVTRTDGSMVVVTADRPDLAAAVLESLRAQRPRG
ncbi:hypothetical protein [Agrococcus jejuensis]|uniref:PH domain-containing protein n=1 Tax=Agrococcus jejuensis TaxID=399736 RepID=A0A1G8B049_9MICO|nr:hypothetical protein [Agrococcus jejuensis]SDH26531.1 hypothetical protein SAMN04489720_0599 [Agrococcus jejuensis]